MLRNLRALGFAGVLLATIVATLGTNRITVYSGQNPTQAETNLEARFLRTGNGTFMRDILAALNLPNGTWSNLTITSGTGLFVTVNATNSSQLGALYQLSSVDPSPLPTSPATPLPTPLPADSTNVALIATQAGNTTPLGPLTAPGTVGQSVYWLIEAQVSIVDKTPLTLQFLNSSGVLTPYTVNTVRADTISYQTKAGTAAVSPVIPSADSGWFPIGWVLIANGTTQVTSGMITMDAATKFGVFGASAPLVLSGLALTCPHCVDTNTALQSINVDKQFAQGNNLYFSYSDGTSIRGGTNGALYESAGASQPNLTTGNPFQATAQDPEASIVRAGATLPPHAVGPFAVYHDTGLTPAATYTPTPVLYVDENNNANTAGGYFLNVNGSQVYKTFETTASCQQTTQNAYQIYDVTGSHALFDVGLDGSGRSSMGLCGIAGQPPTISTNNWTTNPYFLVKNPFIAASTMDVIAACDKTGSAPTVTLLVTGEQEGCGQVTLTIPAPCNAANSLCGFGSITWSGGTAFTNANYECVLTPSGTTAVTLFVGTILTTSVIVKGYGPAAPGGNNVVVNYDCRE
jgi:hypothetical protein